MSNVMVSFRLDRETPMQIRWTATDGAPGEVYKAQITHIVLPDGTRLAMHSSSILEQMQDAGDGTYMMSFTGMIGYAADHADRALVEELHDCEVDYEVDFVHEDGHSAVPARDYEIVERPRAMARKLP